MLGTNAPETRFAVTVTSRDLVFPLSCFLYGIAWFAGRDGAIVPSSFILYGDSQRAREAHSHIAQRKEIVELYDRLRPSLYQYLICLGLKPQDSDDVIQETFLRLFRFQAGGGSIENPRSWVFRVAHNLSLDVHKTEQRLISEGNEEVTSVAFERPDSSLNPEEIFLQKEQLLRLDAAMSHLTERQKHFVHLRAEGLRYREIAEVLGTTISTVNENLRRAIARITESLYD